MITLKASTTGLIKIKQARKEKGWNINDSRWLESASEVLGVSREQAVGLATGISHGTWKRFLSGKKPINQAAFQAYCQVLELQWQEVCESKGDRGDRPCQDWGMALDVSIFFNRTEELTTLSQSIVQDKCRLIALLGMGGIGKTALSVKLAQLVQAEFDYIIWRSLRNAPSIEETLAELIQFVSCQQETHLPTDWEQRISLLLKYFRSARCLLILDNVESILPSGGVSYRGGYEGYGQLFELIGATQHQSCLILTSREKPQELNILEAKNLPIRYWQLQGLTHAEGKAIFQTKGSFSGTLNQWQTLTDRYGGNPLALKIVASTIQESFQGNLADFLQVVEQDLFIVDDLCFLLQSQFQRLSELETQILYWLAVNREPVSLTELQADLVPSTSLPQIIQALTCLQNRSLIEKISGCFTQQPVVMEYAIAELIDRVATEIANQAIVLFNRHALVKAQAKEYVRDAQIGLILQPLIEVLITVFGSASALEKRLQSILASWRSHPQPGYLSGNIINLLRQLNADLSGYDFSGLTVWQANLQGLNLHQVNFANADLSQSVFTATLGNILAAAFSPQASIFATCDNWGKVRLWEGNTGKLLSVCHGHTHWIRCVAFSPDGKYLVSGSGDRTVKVWQSSTGKCLTTFTGHTDEIYTVVFSPGGNLVVSGSGDGTIRLWEVQTGKCLNLLSGHSNWVRSVAFSADGKILASGSADQTIRLWNIQTGECLNILTGHRDWVRSVAFSPEGNILASGSSDRTVRLWNISTGECFQTYNGHGSGVYAVAFSPDGKILASGSGDCTIRLWNRETDRCAKTIYGHTNQIISLDFNADGQTIVCASLDRTVKLWDTTTGKCLRTLQGQIDLAFPIAFSPPKQEQALLASISSDYTVRLWQTDTGECCRILRGHTDHIWSVAFSPNGNLLASCGADQQIRLWDIDSGECCQILPGHRDWVRSVAFSTDGQTLASSGADKTVKLWNLPTGEYKNIPVAQVWSIAFSPNGKILATGSTDQTVKLWDVQTGQCWQTYVANDCQGFYAVVFSPDGEVIASGSADGQIRLWNIQTGKCYQTLAGHKGFVFSVAFSPDGKYLVSGSSDQTVKLWDVQTGQCWQTYRGHINKVYAVAFSPDGKVIASGSQDQSIRLWSVATGKCLRILRSPRLYEGMNLTGVTGLSPAQKETLKILGARESI